MKMRQIVSIFLFLVVGLFCLSCGNKTIKLSYDWDTIPQKYAQLLHIYKKDRTFLVIIENPWKRGSELHRYMLVPHDMELTDDVSHATVIRVPLQRLCTFTVAHCHLLCELGAYSHIAGICEAEYVLNAGVKEHLCNGDFVDMGNALHPNVERILLEKCDGLLVSPFEESGYGALERAGIPLIECADYMETSALGRAEWMRFFGMLVGKQFEADSLFESVERNYNTLCSLQKTSKERNPKLLCDLMNGATWFVPGGESTLGRLYCDAGADYPFADKKQNGSLRFSYETILKYEADADVWLIKYGRSEDFTYASLLLEQERYANFRPFKEHHIYGCNTSHVPFFDEEPFHPDYLLADAIKIFHPLLLPEWELHYFSPIK